MALEEATDSEDGTENHPTISYTRSVSRSGSASIDRFPTSLRRKPFMDCIEPIVVPIGPYHHLSDEMNEAKLAAVDLFCQGSGQSEDEVRDKIRSVAKNAQLCYADEGAVERFDDDEFVEMMLMDGCFLLQFMISMCPDDPDAPPDEFMLMAAVHTRIDVIARDVMLLENQIPWLVLEVLMEIRPVTVHRFLDLMAATFDVGNNARPTDRPGGDPGDPEPPPHLLGLFQRRQVGAARTQDLRTPRLSSMSCTAVELAEMGVKLTASKTRRFGEMGMRKWRGGLLGVFGKLSLSPVFLNSLTICWLVNMTAYEACVGARLADSYAVSSYLSVVALIMNRDDDVRELRAKGIIHSAYSDQRTLFIFKSIGSDLRYGHRYYSIFQGIEEYKQQRWMWIEVHRFFYKNFKTIVTVLSIIGVLVGIFKTLLSLKSRQR